MPLLAAPTGAAVSSRQVGRDFLHIPELWTCKMNNAEERCKSPEHALSSSSSGNPCCPGAEEAEVAPAQRGHLSCHACGTNPPAQAVLPTCTNPASVWSEPARGKAQQELHLQTGNVLIYNFCPKSKAEGFSPKHYGLCSTQPVQPLVQGANAPSRSPRLLVFLLFFFDGVVVGFPLCSKFVHLRRKPPRPTVRSVCQHRELRHPQTHQTHSAPRGWRGAVAPPEFYLLSSCFDPEGEQGDSALLGLSACKPDNPRHEACTA